MSCDAETEIDLRTHVIVSKYRGSPTAIARELARAEINLQSKVVALIQEVNQKNDAKKDARYWKKQAIAANKRMLDLTAFLRKIMVLGMLRGTPRLRDEALLLLDGENLMPDIDKKREE